MKNFFILFVILFLSACSLDYVDPLNVDTAEENQALLDQMKEDMPDFEIFEGNYFTIEYPEDFSVEIFESGDEAKFLSSDEKVEFFVFSPQWGGEPESYLDLAENEEIVSEMLDDRGEGLDRNFMSWVTVKDVNDEYFRSYVVEKNQYMSDSELVKVFGIKYVDEDSYNEYSLMYDEFKKSLVQFAD